MPTQNDNGPPALATLDYETYYDKEYSLKKMSVEDYITDPRFEVILVSLKLGDAPAFWHSGDHNSTREFLYDHRVQERPFLAQNTIFDQLINQRIFGIRPPLLLDTMCMGQALLKPYIRSVSLGAMLRHVKFGIKKGDYVHKAIGMRRSMFDDNGLQNYAGYCMNDTEGTYALFQYFKSQMPREELAIIDMTLRMYLEPQLRLNTSLLQQIWSDAKDEKLQLMSRLPEEIGKADLMSNVKFAKLLTSLGVDIPMKISPTTDKPTYAFAKNDPEFKDLEEEYEFHPTVSAILTARKGVKSTLAETRAERLLGIATKHKKFRIPLRYYAAHTGRYGGMDKINAQNFPRIDPKKNHRNQLRYAIEAPKHHVVLAADLKQIEARKNAWLAGCELLLEMFREGRDVYSEFASLLYRRTILKGTDDLERFVGKTCILGLGFGMGHKKLRNTLRKDDIKLDEPTSIEYVQTYRHTYWQIPNLWTHCNDTIETIAHGGKRRIGPCVASHNAIKLPNGMSITYNNLRYVEKEKYSGWVYDYGGRTRTIWGGKMVENIVQALARIKIMNDMVQIKKEIKLAPVLQGHDELVYIVLEKEAEAYAKEIERIMLVPPDFAPDLPVGVEIAFGPTYGDAK